MGGLHGRPGKPASRSVQLEGPTHRARQLQTAVGHAGERAVRHEQVAHIWHSRFAEPAEDDRTTTDRSYVAVRLERLRPKRQALLSCVDHRFGDERQEHLADHPQVSVDPLGIVVHWVVRPFPETNASPNCIDASGGTSGVQYVKYCIPLAPYARLTLTCHRISASLGLRR